MVLRAFLYLSVILLLVACKKQADYREGVVGTYAGPRQSKYYYPSAYFVVDTVSLNVSIDPDSKDKIILGNIQYPVTIDKDLHLHPSGDCYYSGGFSNDSLNLILECGASTGPESRFHLKKQ